MKDSVGTSAFACGSRLRSNISGLKAVVLVTGLWKQRMPNVASHADKQTNLDLHDASSEFESSAQEWRLQGGGRCTATTSVTSASATLSATLTLTHILPIKEPVRLHCPPPVSNVTCPSHYQAPWSPTVSAHVIGPIARHACIFVLHFLSLLLPSCCFNSRTLENKASDVQRQSKRGRNPWWTHTFSVFFPINDRERRCAFEPPCPGQQRFFRE